jgi:hypothetical protein
LNGLMIASIFFIASFPPAPGWSGRHQAPHGLHSALRYALRYLLQNPCQLAAAEPARKSRQFAGFRGSGSTIIKAALNSVPRT